MMTIKVPIRPGAALSDPETYRQRLFELSVAGYFADPRRARDLTPFRITGRVLAIDPIAFLIVLLLKEVPLQGLGGPPAVGREATAPSESLAQPLTARRVEGAPGASAPGTDDRIAGADSAPPPGAGDDAAVGDRHGVERRAVEGWSG